MTHGGMLQPLSFNVQVVCLFSFLISLLLSCLVFPHIFWSQPSSEHQLTLFHSSLLCAAAGLHSITFQPLPQYSNADSLKLIELSSLG